MATFWSLLEDVIPGDHARQVTSRYYAEQLLAAPDAPQLVVDLGCGRGESRDVLRALKPDLQWLGVDIGGSMESEARTDGRDVVLFDGVRLPFVSRSIPLIYCHQVFEHVRHPEPLLAEIARVLAPGGHFVGSTSQLEPYHSHSLWNYTAYGFRVLVESAGLRLVELRPSIDGITLVRRSFAGRPPELSRYFAEESPLNVEIDEWGLATGRSARQINARKLSVCGQFAFHVRR